MLMGRRWSRSPTVTDCGPVWSRIPARNSANPQILKALFHNLYVHYSPLCHEARPDRSHRLNRPGLAGDRHRVGWPFSGESFRLAGPVQRTNTTERSPMGWMGRLLGPPLRWSRLLTWLVEMVLGRLITHQSTGSSHGGVVLEPSYRK